MGSDDYDSTSYGRQTLKSKSRKGFNQNKGDFMILTIGIVFLLGVLAGILVATYVEHGTILLPEDQE